MFTEPFDRFYICPTIFPRKSKNKQRLCTINLKKRMKKKSFYFESPTTLSFNNTVVFLNTTTIYNMLCDKESIASKILYS